MSHAKLIIVGSGPAAWTCGIYASRAGLAPVLFEGAASEDNRQAMLLPLGQLAMTTEVENFPGFPHGQYGALLRSALSDERIPTWVERGRPQPSAGIRGPELMELMRQQAIHSGCAIESLDIASVDLSRMPFEFSDSSAQRWSADTLVIATGARANWLGLESEARYRNQGVSACATCDGPLFRDRPVVVVGGGDAAVEEALHLSRLCSTVHLVHRRDTLRAHHALAQRLYQQPNIQIIWNHVLDEVLGDGQRMTGVRVKHTITGDTRAIEASGLFVAIGHSPNTSFLRGQVETDAGGYIVVKRDCEFGTATSVPGVFAAGDVADARYRQAVTAAGTGCMAALDAERWLSLQ